MNYAYVQWVENSQHFGEHPYSSRTHVWLRRNPPARAWRNELGTGGSGWSYDVVDERGHLHTASTWQNSILMPSHEAVDPDTLFRGALAPLLPSSDEVKDDGDRSQGWSITTEEQDGERLVQYHREVMRSHFLVKQRIWAKPETREIVRGEIRETDVTSGRDTEFTFYDQYLYDLEPPEGTFEMPKGKLVEEPDDPNFMPEVWGSMSSGERRDIAALILALDESWKSADFNRFSRLWKFGTVEQAPSGSFWQSTVEGQRGVWAEWTSEINRVRYQDFVPVRVGRSTFTWGRKKQVTLAVMAELSATSAHTGQKWKGTTEVFIWIGRRDRSGNREMHIVHWDLPLPEIVAEVDAKSR